MPQLTDEIVATSKTAPTADDRAQQQMTRERLRSDQNLAAGAAAGLAASLAGAAGWAAITYTTNYQIGWMAVGVGLLVGIAVRKAGRGVDNVFGLVGSGLSLLGCVLGNLLTVCIAVSSAQEIPFMQLMGQLTPAVATEFLTATFSPIDLLFYGIAIYEGYHLSFRSA